MEQSVVLGFGVDGVRDGGFLASGSDPRGSWLYAHEELVKLARKRAGLDFEEGRLLLRALRGEAHARLGYGSFAEYVERLFGYGPRQTREKLRVAQALEELPKTAHELQAGKVSFSAVRELTRVATPETEGEWLEAVREKTVREVEELVSGQHPGDLPGDVADSGAKRHVLRFDVSAEVFATFREAMTKVRHDAGQSLDDDAALLLLSRHVLGASRPGAPRDEGRSSYQIALTICEVCRRGSQQARGEFQEIPPEVVAMACCDAQHIGRLEGTGVAVGSGETRVSAETHVGAKTPRATQSIPRATQSIPPAIRRLVLRRDRGRCKVPGCRHATFVDVHHLDLRSDGGGNYAENLVTLCSAHHRANHRGELLIDGTPSTGLRFSHADGTAYGGSPSPAVAAVRAKACRALELMGYREKEAKRALARIPSNLELSLEQIILKALREVSSHPQHARS